MKKIFNYTLAILFGLIAFTSCDLTRLSEDDVSPESYFSSADECRLWLDRCYYNYLAGPDDIILQSADDFVMANPNDIIQGLRLVTDSYSGELAWGWETMRRINMFFQYCDQCKDVTAREYYKGVAYFFRALGYFEKVKRFGDVPWYDKVVGSSDTEALNKARDPRGLIMLHIMEDLDNAIERLDEEHSVARVNKWTALALKSRVALFEGTWRIYHAGDVFAPKNDPTEYNGQKVTPSAEYFLTLAADAASEVISDGGYSLYSGDGTSLSYRTLFCSPDAKDGEVILAILYNYETLKFGHKLPYKFKEQSMGFTKRFMNHYLNADGSRYTDTKGYENSWYLDEVRNRDPRMAQTVLCPGYTQFDKEETTINDLANTYTGYKPIKYIYDDNSLQQGKATSDFPVFRLAEVMLNYAEAKAELGTLSQDDLDKTVNKIRSRVGMPALKLDATLDPYMEACYPSIKLSGSAQKALVLEVRRERTVELVMEGFRQWDMLRWAEGPNMVNGNSTEKPNTVSSYKGVYIAGPGIFDMDGDGKEDFEIYSGANPTRTDIKTNISISSLKDKLYDPENPTSAEPAKGYMTCWRDHIVSWDNSKDYLYPVPNRQIILTSGTLTQNPGW